MLKSTLQTESGIHLGCVQKRKLFAIVFFNSGPLLLLALVIRYRDPGLNIRCHFALLNATQDWFADIQKQVSLDVSSHFSRNKTNAAEKHDDG